MQSTTATKCRECQVAHLAGIDRTGEEIGVVVEVGDMPIESR